MGGLAADLSGVFVYGDFDGEDGGVRKCKLKERDIHLDGVLVLMQARLDDEEVGTLGEFVLEFDGDFGWASGERPAGVGIKGGLLDADGGVDGGEDDDDINRAAGGESCDGFAGESAAANPAGVRDDAADPVFFGGVDFVIFEKRGGFGAALVWGGGVEPAGEGGRADGWVAWFGH